MEAGIRMDPSATSSRNKTGPSEIVDDDDDDFDGNVVASSRGLLAGAPTRKRVSVEETSETRRGCLLPAPPALVQARQNLRQSVRQARKALGSPRLITMRNLEDRPAQAGHSLQIMGRRASKPVSSAGSALPRRDMDSDSFSNSFIGRRPSIRDFAAARRLSFSSRASLHPEVPNAHPMPPVQATAA